MREIRVELDNGNYYLINEALSSVANDNYIVRKYTSLGLDDTFKANDLRGCFDEIALDIKTDEALVRGTFS